MKPVPQPETTVTCKCGWSRRLPITENAEEVARYHRIQVHNDLKAVAKGRF